MIEEIPLEEMTEDLRKIISDVYEAGYAEGFEGKPYQKRHIHPNNVKAFELGWMDGKGDRDGSR